MNKFILFGILTLSIQQLTIAQESSKPEDLLKELAELLVTNNKTEFLNRFSPTKEDLLEFSYGKKADKVKKKEKSGFYDSVEPAIGMLKNNLNSSFDFVYNKVTIKEFSKVDSIEIKKSTQSKIGETDVQNFYFVIADGSTEFKVELLGLYQTSRGWIIMTDIAPGYF